MRSDSLFVNFLKITVIFLCLICVASFSRADTENWHLIAHEDAGSNSFPSFLGLTPRWTYSELAISTNKISVNAQERTVVYGSAVPIIFQNLNAAYPVKLEMTFLSDSADRAVRILAGNSVLQNQLPIPFAAVLRKNWIIPSDSIKNGRLDIHVERLTGPNAVVCGFWLYSSDPHAQKIHPVSFHIAPLFVPHRIERPSYVQGISALRLNLNGIWRFYPDASARGNWKTIRVPGEWAMQGFTVSPHQEAEYQRSFYAPAQWKNCRVILKCAGVYSAARVYVNSQKVGMHIGGFTQFEFDITSCLRFGQTNSISIYIRSASLADRLASGMQYAAHDLGGITRDIHLMAAPKAYLEDEHIVTRFDRNFRNALLEVGATVTVKSPAIGHKLRMRYIMRDASGKDVRLNRGTLFLPTISIGNGERIHRRFSVLKPLKWDPEHPHLYTLEIQIISGRRILEKVPCRFGFRQIDVRGGRVFVNNHPIKLRGVCRHETDPLRGRSLLPGMWTRDVALFRAANVNIIRTSHYPPPEELVQACDELGMFVEEEAPFCWANPTDSEDAAYVSQAEMEMALRDRNHPSVLQWSLGNESPWSMAFVAGYHALRTLDTTRPFLFDGGGEPSPPPDIDAPHYPGLAAPASYAHSPRPVFIGEESHLECYNRKEILTDPGLRDIWEMGFSQMWENMYHSDGCEGGDIWAGIDDNFFPPSGKIVGYGQWGIIDGWRRLKPEYWEVKKVYSPLRITEESIHPTRFLRLKVENREIFTNLNELRFSWMLGKRSGVVHCSASPGHSGVMIIPLETGIHPGQELLLKVYSPQGFLVDAYSFLVGRKKDVSMFSFTPGTLKLQRQNDEYEVLGNGFQVSVNAKSGQIASIISGGVKVLTGGPILMLEPKGNEGFSQISDSGNSLTSYNNKWTGWNARDVAAVQTPDGVEFRVQGQCDQAKGSYTLRISPGGRVEFNCDFTSKTDIDLWQEGWAFELPLSCENLTWNRKARWNYYPPDHIGRPIGAAFAHDGKPLTGPFGPVRKPSWSWSQDDTTWGTNDFRSTKRNVYYAALMAKSGAGLQFISNGTQGIRCWVDGNKIAMYLMDYGNEGSPDLFNQRMVSDWRLTPGSMIKEKLSLQILSHAAD